jgi:hypothetical protein
MARTDGLPRPNGGGRIPSPARQEGKRYAQRARCEAGVTYEQIAQATGRSMQLVYDAMNVNDDRRHLSYADLIAMSRHTMTKTFVAHLLEPIEQNVKPKEPK